MYTFLNLHSGHLFNILYHIVFFNMRSVCVVTCSAVQILLCFALAYFVPLNGMSVGGYSILSRIYHNHVEQIPIAFTQGIWMFVMSGLWCMGVTAWFISALTSPHLKGTSLYIALQLYTFAGLIAVAGVGTYGLVSWIQWAVSVDDKWECAGYTSISFLLLAGGWIPIAIVLSLLIYSLNRQRSKQSTTVATEPCPHPPHTNALTQSV